MTNHKAPKPTGSKTTGSLASRQLRLWPGIALVSLQWLLRFVVPAVAPVPTALPVLGALGAGLAIFLWWIFFSRARLAERLGVPLLVVGFMILTSRFLDETVATSMLGMAFPILAIPVVCLALVAWAVITRNQVGGLRWATLALFIGAACAIFPLLRTEGITSTGDSTRKSPTTASPARRWFWATL